MTGMIGEVVHFDFGGKCYPAIIVAVWSAYIVNLKVIDDGPFGAAATYNDWTPDRSSVPKGLPHNHMTWHLRQACD